MRTRAKTSRSTRTGFRAPRSTSCSTSSPIASRTCRSIRRSSRASAAWSIRSGGCRVEDSNEGFLIEQVQATAFVAHPYQIPTIGWPADIQGWKIEDLQNFFKTNYAPNNCTLILVGDCQRGRRLRAREEISRADSAAGAAAAGAHHRARADRREARVRRARRADAAALLSPTSRPRPTTRRARRINLLMSILTEGNSSRLHRLLVEEKKLAIEVGGTFQEGFDPGLTWLQLTLPEGANIAEPSRSALDAALAEVVAQGVTDAELARAKNLYASTFWKQLATINGKAGLLGAVRSLRRRLQEAVRFAGDLRQGDARGRAEGRGARVPEESPHGRRAGGEAMKRRPRSERSASHAVRRRARRCPAGRRHRRRRMAPPAGVKVPANQRFVLPNGLTIVLVPKKGRAAHRVQRFRARWRARGSRRQARRRLAGRGAARSRRGQAQRVSNSRTRSKAWAAVSTPRRVPRRSR